jgi:hypothetical protein
MIFYLSLIKTHCGQRALLVAVRTFDIPDVSFNVGRRRAVSIPAGREPCAAPVHRIVGSEKNWL